jgi:hypothetical protein
MRITILGAVAVAPFTLCKGSAPDPDWDAVFSPDTASLASLIVTPDTLPAMAAACLDGIPGGEATLDPPCVLPKAPNSSVGAVRADEEESPVHPMRAQTAIAIEAIVFISDSVEVSRETPTESVVAHLGRQQHFDPALL